MKKSILFLLVALMTTIVTFSQTVVWSEDFEDDPSSRWSVSSGVWEMGVPSSGPIFAHGGTQLAATVLDGSYPSTADTRLIRSAYFTVPSADQNPRLRFWHWFSFGYADQGKVQIHVQGTPEYEWIDVSDPYVYTGSSVWSYVSRDLSGYAGQIVQVAFYFNAVHGTPSSDEGSGWYIDDISLITGPYEFNNPESFENGIGDWYAQAGTWEVGNPESGPGLSFNGNNCAATVLAGDYEANVDSRLVSPFFTVPLADLNPRLRFWHWFSFGYADYGMVQIHVKGSAELINVSGQYINTGSSVWSSPSIDLSAYAGQIIRIAFYFHAIRGTPSSDESSGWYIDDISLVTGPDIFNNPESFENGIGDWYAQAGTWEVGNPTSGPGSPNSGSNCAATVLAGNYGANVDSRLVSPFFTVPPADENPRLRFWHWFSFEFADYGLVQVHIKGSAELIDVSEQYVNSSSSGWSCPSIDLSAYAGQIIRIAFYFHAVRGTPSSDESSGWYIDDISITNECGPSATLSVSPQNENVPGSPSGVATFSVLSNCSWTATSDQEWCSVTTSGTGDGTIEASYSENITPDPRTANISVTVSGLDPVIVLVTQSGTPPLNTVTDVDGNTYNTVTIGSQVWMAENLRTTRFNDNTPIPAVSDPDDWSNLTTPGYCWYNNDETSYKNVYGALYNWYTVNSGDLCPAGWHVPGDYEWKTLEIYLGMSQTQADAWNFRGTNNEGGKLRETGTAHWTNNDGATNETGFTALPGGRRYFDGDYTYQTYFTNLATSAFFWTSSEDVNGVIYRNLINGAEIGRSAYPKNAGFSVRCVKNLTPLLSTSAISSVSPVSAIGGGNVFSEGESPVTARGVCWDIYPNPTTALVTKTINGTGTGSFISPLSNLSAETVYYIRAYATNSYGTIYGNEIMFETRNNDAVVDIEGNYYNTVVIGSQVWMAENLKTTRYNDNTQIPNITAPEVWSNLSTPAFVWYNNDEQSNKDTYGALYNWYAVGTGNLCPAGWHIPSDQEYKTLEMFLGMSQAEADAGGSRGTHSEGQKLKEAGSVHWGPLNQGATNESGFTALPGGTLFVNHWLYGTAFSSLGGMAFFWSSTENEFYHDYGLTRALWSNASTVERSDGDKRSGLSVRCIQNPTLITSEISLVTKNSAQSGGIIPDDIGSPIIVRGVCWSTDPHPTVTLDTKTADGAGTGSFISNLPGLEPGTAYYLRAYATTGSGTIYGFEKRFRTFNSDAISDIDGNWYNIKTIGSQVWMTENLKTTTLNDGAEIINETNPEAWASHTDPAYCWYDNSETAYKSNYGALYNWYTVASGKLCPAGWHVPSDSEWKTLEIHLGMTQAEADGINGRGSHNESGKLREIGTVNWIPTNEGATNESGFNALPGGLRIYRILASNSEFIEMGGNAHFWTSTEHADITGWARTLVKSDPLIYRSYDFKYWGYSVRCLRDNTEAQSIIMSEGWNLLSFAAVPAEISMRTILDPLIIPDVLVKVQDEKGKAVEHLSAGWINEIGDMSVSEGYKIRVTGETNLSITGQPVALPLNIPLESGWNIIGYPSMNPQPASTVFGSLISSGALVKVQNELGLAIEQIEGTWNYGFTNLVPGEGYKVMTNTGATLTITRGAKGAVPEEEREKKETEHFIPKYKGNGLDHMNIYIGRMGEDGNGRMGDKYEIGVFDGDICVGACVVGGEEDRYITLTASFDDPETVERDGFTEGNTLMLRLWNRETGEETELRDTEPMDGYRLVFERQGTTLLMTKNPGEVSSWLGDAYPNPSRDRTTFTFGLAGESRVRLEIIDVLGNTVAIVIDETMPGGIHRVDWDNMTASGEKPRAGMYLFKLTVNGSILIKQIVVHSH